MKNFHLLIILIIILIAVSFIQKEGVGSNNQKKNITTPTSTPTPVQSGPTLIPTKSPAPTLILFTPTPIPSSKKNIRSFIYPGSTILNQSDNELSLQSTDDPTGITNWYKEKIINLNIKAQSFVQTNTNGNVLNKLVGAGAGFKVKIQIEKNNSNPVTAIKVSIE